jgi:hypothetical protein
LTKNTRDDLVSLDNIIHALYEVISGPANQKRDKKRFRSLFMRGARIIPTSPRGDGGGAIARVYKVGEFYQRVNKNTAKMGFYEKEIARQTQTYGNIAHVFSTYESRSAADDTEPFARGVNSIQLLKDGDHWQVVTIFWDFERSGNAIPKQYLPKTKKAAKRT